MPLWSKRALIPVVGLLLVATACGDGEKKASRAASSTSTSDSSTTSTSASTPTTGALVVRPTARLTAQRTTRPAVQRAPAATPAPTVQPTVRAATTTTRRPAATTTTRPTDPFAGDPAKARAAALRLDDLPAGFAANGTAEDKDPTPDPIEDDLYRCLGGDPAAIHRVQTAGALSPDFSKDALLAYGEATLFSDAAVLGPLFASRPDDQTSKCFADSARAAFAQDSGPQPEVTAEVIDLGRYGDQSFGVRVTSKFTVDSQPVTFVDELVMVRNGRALRLYLFGNDSQPFPEADAKAALTKATTRT